MKYYLAYGSNLNATAMYSRCYDSKMFGTAVIHGYRLTSQGSVGSSYFTIIPSETETVPVGVWKISDKDEKALDFYEGYPSLYRKETIKVDVNCFDGSVKTVEALVYIMNDKGIEVMPQQYYIEMCEKGYQDFGLDIDYLSNVLDTLKEKSRSLGTRIPSKKVALVNHSGFVVNEITVSEFIRDIIEMNQDCCGAVTVVTGDDRKRYPTISYRFGQLSGGRCQDFSFLGGVVSSYVAEENYEGDRKDYFVTLKETPKQERGKNQKTDILCCGIM